MLTDSRWGDIYKLLEAKGFDVYAPGQHKGECTSKYIVVKMSSMSSVQGCSSGTFLYDLMMYVPKDEYSQLEGFISDVENAMKDLEPMIMPMYFRTSSFYDDSLKGHMVSSQYRNTRKF